MEKEIYLSMNQCAYLLDISLITIERWYRWYSSDFNNHPELKLPIIIREGGKRGKKYIKKEDFKLLEDFKNKLPRGAMAEYNATFCWGTYGDSNLEKKGLERTELKKTYHKTKKPI